MTMADQVRESLFQRAVHEKPLVRTLCQRLELTVIDSLKEKTV